MLVDAFTAGAIEQAAKTLASGQLVVFPTETVYGLGANAADDDAVKQIFRVKKRPPTHPLIVHVLDVAAAEHFCLPPPEFASRLIENYWPGPLTLILNKKPTIANTCSGDQNSIGVRCPSHPVARQLLQACRRYAVYGVAAPSANEFGKLSPTRGEHVKLNDDLLILEAGDCPVGIESCIIDCTRSQPVLLRPGVLDIEEIAMTIGQSILLPQQMTTPAPRASGTLSSHYAPTAALHIFSSAELNRRLEELTAAPTAKIAVYARSNSLATNNWVSYYSMPEDAAAAAQQLFAQLYYFDCHGFDQIWVEAVPDDNRWLGVKDRLQRAAAR